MYAKGSALMDLLDGETGGTGFPLGIRRPSTTREGEHEDFRLLRSDVTLRVEHHLAVPDRSRSPAMRVPVSREPLASDPSLPTYDIGKLVRPPGASAVHDEGWLPREDLLLDSLPVGVVPAAGDDDDELQVSLR